MEPNRTHTLHRQAQKPDWRDSTRQSYKIDERDAMTDLIGRRSRQPPAGM